MKLDDTIDRIGDKFDNAFVYLYDYIEYENSKDYIKETIKDTLLDLQEYVFDILKHITSEGLDR